MITTIIITILVLFFFLAIGMPVGITLAASGSVGLILMGGWSDMLAVISTSPYRNTASWLLTTVPMFVLMAEFLSGSKISSDFFNFANKWLGRLPGGLAIATVLTSAALGAVSGSSTAAAGLMTKIASPEMVKYGYNEKMAYGVVATAGTLAILIPPSVILMVFGIMTGTSIGDLFFAGIIPGLVSVTAYILATLLWIRWDKNVAGKSLSYSWRERIQSIKSVWPTLVLVILVLGGIYSGIVTVTEAAAIGAAGAFVIGLCLRMLNWQTIKQSIVNTTKITAMIYMLIIGAHIFGYFLSYSNTTQDFISSIFAMGLNKWVILIAMIVIYLILGCFMDQFAILVITIPVVFPLLMKLGFHPLWIGILIAKTVEIGLATPPVGLNVFITSSIGKVKAEKVFAGAMPYLVVDGLISILVLIFIPGVVTWLPSILR